MLAIEKKNHAASSEQYKKHAHIHIYIYLYINSFKHKTYNESPSYFPLKTNENKDGNDISMDCYYIIYIIYVLYM